MKMNLREALRDISSEHYIRVCGYTYRPLKVFGHRTYKELPSDLQDGIIVLITHIYTVQKMCYIYDIELVAHYMKMNGIKLKPFFSKCDLPDTFFRTLSIQRNRELRLMSIRLELIRMLNRLFRYVLD